MKSKSDEVFARLERGESDRKIASDLGIARNTVAACAQMQRSLKPAWDETDLDILTEVPGRMGCTHDVSFMLQVQQVRLLRRIAVALERRGK